MGPVAPPHLVVPSRHKMRGSDSSLFDTICVKCGRVDVSGLDECSVADGGLERWSTGSARQAAVLPGAYSGVTLGPPATRISECSPDSLPLRVLDMLRSIADGWRPPPYNVRELVKDLWNELVRLTPTLGERGRGVLFCPQCGNGVKCDEDGLCGNCGSTTCDGPMLTVAEGEQLRQQVTNLQAESTRSVLERRDMRNLLERARSALQRHIDGHGPMRIPADPRSDSDLVQADIDRFFERGGR